MITYVILKHFKKIYPILAMACMMVAIANHYCGITPFGMFVSITTMMTMGFVIVVYVMNKDDNYAFIPGLG